MAKVSRKNVQIKVKCWVELDGVKFFGPGRAELLQGIIDQGSISKAAKAMGMSYKKAWGMIDEMNSMGNGPYVITTKGGSDGGGTEITEAGRNAIASYTKFNNKIVAILKAEVDLLKI